jgi:hypothetical protein
MSGRFDGEDPLVWLDGISKGVSPANAGYRDKARPVGLENPERPEWQPLWDLADQYEHPYWRQLGEEAIQAGHGGGDYFVMVRSNRPSTSTTQSPGAAYSRSHWRT